MSEIYESHARPHIPHMHPREYMLNDNYAHKRITRLGSPPYTNHTLFSVPPPPSPLVLVGVVLFSPPPLARFL